MAAMNINNHVKNLRNRVLTCGFTRKVIADATGGVLSDSWVYKFAVGRMNNPRLKSLIALENALDQLTCSKQAA